MDVSKPIMKVGITSEIRKSSTQQGRNSLRRLMLYEVTYMRERWKRFSHYREQHTSTVTFSSKRRKVGG